MTFILVEMRERAVAVNDWEMNEDKSRGTWRVGWRVKEKRCGREAG